MMPRKPAPPALIAGPYKPPRVRISRVTFDRIRGDVTVVGVSDAPIAWATAKTEPRVNPVPLMTVELERAVRTESVEAVAHHWGVSRWTVNRWRRALGVGRMTPGTKARFAELAPAKLHGPPKGVPRESKLTPAKAAEVRRRSLAGETRTALAAEFHISRQYVSQIARGLRRKERI